MYKYQKNQECADDMLATKPGSSQTDSSKPVSMVFDRQDDEIVRRMFGEKGCTERGIFLLSNNPLSTPLGYKLHINVSDRRILWFLGEAIPLLESAHVSFKVWRPSELGIASQGQQGKLVTIYSPSRLESVTALELLKPTLSVMGNDIHAHPPQEKPAEYLGLGNFVSYRYCGFLASQTIANPWNLRDGITDEQSRRGAVASWARGIDERPLLVSRSDIVEGGEKAKIGDAVRIQLQEGAVARLRKYDHKVAELLMYYQHSQKLSLLVFTSKKKPKVLNNVPLVQIAESPSYNRGYI
jgi:hypothetical protein